MKSSLDVFLVSVMVGDISRNPVLDDDGLISNGPENDEDDDVDDDNVDALFQDFPKGLSKS